MRYTVTSSQEVQDQLTNIYLDAVDKSLVSRASNDIDAALKSAPLSHGVAQGEVRLLSIKPLAVVYTVSDEDRIVTILEFILQGS